MISKKFLMLFLVILFISPFTAVAQSWESWLSAQSSDHPKISRALQSLLNKLQSEGDAFAWELARHIPLYDFYRQGDRIRVVIELNPDTARSPIMRSIREHGGEIELMQDAHIQALLPLTRLTPIADLDGVRFIRPPVRPNLDQGTVISEGRRLIGATTWNAAGVDGRNTKIGIIDPDFYRYETLLGRELPPRERVTARSFRRDRLMFDPEIESSHGVAVAEIIHDVAPAAHLNLAAFDTDVEFRQAVDWMIEEKVQVISTSLGFPSGCFRGDGLFEPQIKKAHDAGITWVTSAGNRGQRHWEGTFTDRNNNNTHEFPDSDEALTLEVEFVKLEELGVAVVLVSVIFSWDAPCTGARDDYDIFLFPESQPQSRFRGDWVWRPGVPVKAAGIVGIIRDPRGAGQRDRIGVQIVRKRSDAPAAKLDLVVQACLECRRIEYLVPQGSISIFEPAISPHAISAGAFHQSAERCPRDLCPESNLLVYSSRGPTKDGRIKPDLIAPAHVSTSIYGRYTGDGPGQNPGFDGTSAAAPHVAGAAALIKQLFPQFTPKEIQSFLESKAEDRGRRGKDNDWGAGQLVLGEVVIVPLAPTDLSARGLSPSQIQLAWQDRSDNEEGFAIERRFAQDPEYEEIARVPAESSSVNSPIRLGEGTPVTRYPIWGCSSPPARA